MENSVFKKNFRSKKTSKGNHNKTPLTQDASNPTYFSQQWEKGWYLPVAGITNTIGDYVPNNLELKLTVVNQQIYC